MNGEVHLQIQDSVALMTIDNPSARNALTTEMADTMVAHCDAIDADPNVGAAVVLGADGQFCSGAHRDALANIGRDPAASTGYREHGAVYAAFFRFGNLGVPTVAAVRGGVVGAGLNLMLAADLRIVASTTRILSGFLKIGIQPGGGHFALLSEATNPEVAAAMAIFGEEIDGSRAAELGLAWKSVADDEVEPAAFALAAAAAASPQASREAVAMLRMTTAAPGVPWEVALWAERAPQMRSLREQS